MISETLSPCRIVEKLGGGMGFVYQAEDTDSSKRESRGPFPPLLRMVC